MTFPDFVRLGEVLGIPSLRIREARELESRISETLSKDGPALCEVFIDKAQDFAPKLQSRRLSDGTMVSPALEDMAPFLPREELASIMSVSEAPV